jgi:predicted  nucleic acid-binding Zn-ribbon protein
MDKVLCKTHSDKILEVELTMVEVRSDIKYIKEDLTKINNKLDSFLEKFSTNFAERAVVDDLNKKISNLQSDVKNLEMKWAYATGIAIVVVTVAQIVLKNLGVF